MSSFSILGINHVGLAPKDPEKCRWFFCDVLGLRSLGEELVHPQKTMTLMIASSHKGERGEARLESLSPEAGTEDSPIAKFLAKKGAGIHHVALTVDHVATAIARLAELGVEMIDREPRTGAHQTRIAFVHPNSTGGILVELVEESGKNL